jgi:hypothetical protein
VDVGGTQIDVRVDLLAREYGGTAAEKDLQIVQDRIWAVKARGADLLFRGPDPANMVKMEKGSQKEAAKSIGISEQYFSDIINGRRAVSARVAEYFGYKPLCLFQLIDQVKK